MGISSFKTKILLWSVGVGIFCSGFANLSFAATAKNGHFNCPGFGISINLPSGWSLKKHDLTGCNKMTRMTPATPLDDLMLGRKTSELVTLVNSKTKGNIVPESIYIGVHTNFSFFNVSGSSKDIKSKASGTLRIYRQIYKNVRMTIPLRSNKFSGFESGEFHAVFNQTIKNRNQLVGSHFIVVRNRQYELTLQHRYAATKSIKRNELKEFVKIHPIK